MNRFTHFELVTNETLLCAPRVINHGLSWFITRGYLFDLSPTDLVNPLHGCWLTYGSGFEPKLPRIFWAGTR
jgi:hypothetical protein